MSLFDRSVSVKTGKQGNENVLSNSTLRITFNIKKTHKKSENIAEIDIYNLKPENRQLFSTLDNFIVLDAGYIEFEGEKTIFVGNITDYQIVKDGPNIVTKVTALDGIVATRGKKITRTYAAGVTGNQIINDIVREFNIPKKLTAKVKTIFQDKLKQFTNGFTAGGSAKGVLDQLSDVLGFEYSIQNNVLKITGEDLTDDSQVVVLDQTSGLIGSPIRLNSIDKDKKKKGWEVYSLLRAEYEPTRPVVIDSVEIQNSPFRIEEVTHTGDNWAQDFTSKLIVSEAS